jgi:hypothetical protein
MPLPLLVLLFLVQVKPEHAAAGPPQLLLLTRASVTRRGSIAAAAPAGPLCVRCTCAPVDAVLALFAAATAPAAPAVPATVPAAVLAAVPAAMAAAGVAEGWWKVTDWMCAGCGSWISITAGLPAGLSSRGTQEGCMR